MIPGEVIPQDGDIILNEGRVAITLMVANTGDRPVQVGSHYHVAATNPALDFDREAARGYRLDIAAGTAVRFEPGQRREVQLIPLSGDRRVFGFNGKVMGPLAVVLALFLCAPAAEAQDWNCKDPGNLPQQGMNFCAAQAYARSDAVLNQVWDRVYPPVRGSTLGDKVLTAQRAWLTFRDAACDSEAAVFEGGSLAPLIHATCMTRLTEARIRDLETFDDLT